MSESKEFWFPAKVYGWGWGPPKTWQGWGVLGAFVILLVVGSVLFPPAQETWLFSAYTAILCLVLLASAMPKASHRLGDGA